MNRKLMALAVAGALAAPAAALAQVQIGGSLTVFYYSHDPDNKSSASRGTSSSRLNLKCISAARKNWGAVLRPGSSARARSTDSYPARALLSASAAVTAGLASGAASETSSWVTGIRRRSSFSTADAGGLAARTRSPAVPPCC